MDSFYKLELFLDCYLGQKFHFEEFSKKMDKLLHDSKHGNLELQCILFIYIAIRNR